MHTRSYIHTYKEAGSYTYLCIDTHTCIGKCTKIRVHAPATVTRIPHGALALPPRPLEPARTGLLFVFLFFWVACYFVYMYVGIYIHMYTYIFLHRYEQNTLYVCICSFCVVSSGFFLVLWGGARDRGRGVGRAVLHSCFVGQYVFTFLASRGARCWCRMLLAPRFFFAKLDLSESVVSKACRIVSPHRQAGHGHGINAASTGYRR